MPKVRVLRPFANGHHENIVHPGDEITVTEDRATDLGNLVERVASVKAAPAPANKMAAEPSNKSTPAAVRRGRPPKGR